MDFNLYTIDKKSIFNWSLSIFKDNSLLYKVEPRGIFSKHFEIHDKRGEIMRIKRSNSIFKFMFEIFRGNQKIAVAESGSSFSGIKMQVSTPTDEIYIKGDWKGREFTLLRGADEIAKISKNAWNKKDYLGVAIRDGEDDQLILALIVTLEYLALAQSGSA